MPYVNGLHMQLARKPIPKVHCGPLLQTMGVHITPCMRTHTQSYPLPGKTADLTLTPFPVQMKGVHITLRMRLFCEIFRDGEPIEGQQYEVLNEVVVDRGANPFLTKIECFEKGRLITKVSVQDASLESSSEPAGGHSAPAHRLSSCCCPLGDPAA